MARTAKYTYTAFVDALHAVQARGDAVSVDAIRRELGGGSFAVLKRYLRRWEDAGAADATKKELPDDVAQDVRGWLNRLKDEARAAVEEEYATIRADLTKREAEVERRTRDLEQREAALAGARDLFAQQEGRLAAQLETTTRALTEKGEEAATYRGQLDAARQEMALLREEAARMTTERGELRRMVEAHAQSVGKDVSDLRKRMLESIDALNQATKGVKAGLEDTRRLVKDRTKAQSEAVATVATTVARVESAIAAGAGHLKRHGEQLEQLKRAVDKAPKARAVAPKKTKGRKAPVRTGSSSAKGGGGE